jgi:phosphatidylglycerol:prolipoprotein diacylglycerol transferase
VMGIEGFAAASALARIYWDVSPILVRVGPLAVRWYGLGWFLAFAVGYLIVQRMYRQEGKSEADLDRLLLYMVGGAIIGARLGHFLFYRPGYMLEHPLEVIAIWRGWRGLASHGGALGIMIAFYIYSRRRPDQPYLWLLDRVAAPTALGGCFIRLGNLMNSEILGVPTDVPWAFVFARVDSLPRHPAQLYEASAYFLIFLLLLGVYRKLRPNIPHGLLAGLFLVTVFGARFLIEFLKERHAAYALALALSVGQMLSIPMVLVGAWLVGRALLKSRRE